MQPEYHVGVILKSCFDEAKDNLELKFNNAFKKEDLVPTKSHSQSKRGKVKDIFTKVYWIA
jgi:hypothetical protein